MKKLIRMMGIALVVALMASLAFGSVALADEEKVTVNWNGPNPDISVAFEGTIYNGSTPDDAFAYADVSGSGSGAYGTIEINHKDFYSKKGVSVTSSAHFEGGNYTMETYNQLIDQPAAWGGQTELGNYFHEEGSVADVFQSASIWNIRDGTSSMSFDVSGAEEVVVSGLVRNYHKQTPTFDNIAQYTATATASSTVDASGSHDGRTGSVPYTYNWPSAGLGVTFQASSNMDFVMDTNLMPTAVFVGPGYVTAETTNADFDYIANYVGMP